MPAGEGLVAHPLRTGMESAGCAQDRRLRDLLEVAAPFVSILIHTLIDQNVKPLRVRLVNLIEDFGTNGFR